MAISQRDRRALVLGGGALAVIVVYLSIIDPLIGGYEALRSEHKVHAAKVARIMIDNGKAKYLGEEVGEWERKAGPLGPPRPYSQQITAIGERIVAAAQKSGVQLKNSSWTVARPWGDDPALETATVNLDAEAGWENAFKFIAEVYRIEGVLSVEQMDLAGDPKKGGNLTLRLAVSVFVQAGAKGQGQWSS